MITKEALNLARAKGAHTVLSRYGLDKTAAIPGFLQTLGNATSRAVRTGGRVASNTAMKSMIPLAPNLSLRQGLGTLGTGLSAGAKSFYRAGGVGAAAKTLGAGAAVGTGLYGAGRAFGAGQRDAYKEASSEIVPSIPSYNTYNYKAKPQTNYRPYSNPPPHVQKLNKYLNYAAMGGLGLATLGTLASSYSNRRLEEEKKKKKKMKAK